MSRLGNRPVAKHIIEVLEKNNNEGMCLAEIQKGLIEQGWRHCIGSVRDNCMLLAQNGLLVKIGDQYSISLGRNHETGSINNLKVLDSTPFEPKPDRCDRCGRKFEHGDKFFVRDFRNVRLYVCEECHEQKATVTSITYANYPVLPDEEM